jgi:integrase
MGRRRQKQKTLTGTRIYKRRQHYWYEPKEPVLDPVTGKLGKYHKLCPVSDGEHAARCRKQRILGTVNGKKGEGDFATWFQQWCDKRVADRNAKAPSNPERLQMHKEGQSSYRSWWHQIEDAFRDFNVADIRPSDINEFLEQWSGQRTAEALLSQISLFLKWCAAKGVINVNPAREITLEPVAPRTVHITDDQFEKVRLAAAASGYPHRNGTRTADHNGKMLQIYIELLYLLGQRGADVRLLRWDAVHEDGILVTPTKTETSSGKRVLLPMTPAIKETLEKARALQHPKCDYVLHDRQGRAYSQGTMRNRFARVCKRLGLSGFTLKDIRAKTATDAFAQGYTEEAIKTALVHTDTATTRGYLRRRVVEKSSVRMNLPGHGTSTGPGSDGGEEK